MAWARVLGERMRSRLWPIPAVAATTALLLALALSDLRLGAEGSSLGWAAEPDSARGLLQVLAGSSLTVLALAFSLLVVALQLAASQYSPRVLRTYARDMVVQVSMAILIATFVFSLFTLALFGVADQPPALSVLVASLLGLASVGAFVGVVAHIVSSLRIETMMVQIHDDASEVIGQVYDDAAQDDSASQLDPASDAGSVQVTATTAGFVQAIDSERLVQWAAERDARVRVMVSPGDHVLPGTVLALVSGAEDNPEEGFLRHVLLGHERTPDQDPGFGLLQLTDIAVRALSPGINDPTTARHAIGHLASLLLEMAQHDLTAEHVTLDSSDSPRVWRRDATLSEHIERVCLPVVRNARDSPDVLLSVVRLLGAVSSADAQQAGPGATPVAAHIRRSIDRDMADPGDREAVSGALDALGQGTPSAAD